MNLAVSAISYGSPTTPLRNVTSFEKCVHGHASPNVPSLPRDLYVRAGHSS